VESSQRIATFVAVGLVVVATMVVVYLFNEPDRRANSEEAKIEESAERGVGVFVQYCVACHGEDGKATGRQGIPLNTPQNQEEDDILWEPREEIIRRTIERGRGAIMPAWHDAEGGPLNDEQVTDLVNLIHLGLWEEVTEATLAANDGEIPPPPPVPTPEGGPIDDPVAAQGQELYQANCMGCHTINGDDGTGPTWLGLFGRETPLEDGSTVTADEEYIHESIVDPAAKVHEGFGPIMPPFAQLTDDDINAIIAYIKTLEE
jgi:cytochrome c oxidase subunit II